MRWNNIWELGLRAESLLGDTVVIVRARSSPRAPGELGRCDCCEVPWLSVEHLAAGAGLCRSHQHCFNSAYHLECTAHAGEGWLLHTPMKRKDQRIPPLFLSREEATWLLSGSVIGCGSLCSVSDCREGSGDYEG